MSASIDRPHSELKGLVLAGGKGSRLRPLTATGAKQLVPVANKPVVHYALEQMVEAGITDIGIITGDTAAQVERALGDGSAFGARFTYLRQEAPLGLAHAVTTAEPFLGESSFCMYLGDNFLQHGIVDYADQFRNGNAEGMILLKEVDDPSAFGVAVVGEDGHIRELVEKPNEPISNLAVIGVYFFGPEIHRVTPTLVPSGRGELEITDAISALIMAGHTVDSARITEEWIDTGKKDDMLKANRVVLSSIERRIDGDVDQESRVDGAVIIEKGAVITRSEVRGPVVIGAGARIEDAYIGPFTAIGNDCHIHDCEIEHSIVMSNSIVRQVRDRIGDSLIGKDVVVQRSDGMPRTVKLLLGDHAQVIVT